MILRITGCNGYCEMEPCVVTEPEGTFYPKVRPQGMERIIDAVARDEVAKDLLYTDQNTGKRIRRQEDIPFYKAQVRTILSRNEKVDPIRIYNYIENGGYTAFVKALSKNNTWWTKVFLKKISMFIRKHWIT